MLPDDLVFSVTDFVAVFNQTISYAYPSITIEGEIEGFRISKDRWVYFNLKDEHSSVKFFATVSQLPGPLEDGLMIRVRGTPNLHHLYGFSINVQTMQPVGEGSIKRAAQLLEAKLTKEGLFDESRKRQLAYPPARIGLITSVGSAAYHDFIKILAERWGDIEIEVHDVQVQGEIAPIQIVGALEYFNTHKAPVNVLVLIRGGGSADDLAAFNSEIVTRAVATSRIATLVAIGHEVDISLAEKAADKRGSTPTHAAELLTPDKRQVLTGLNALRVQLVNYLDNQLTQAKQSVQGLAEALDNDWQAYFEASQERLSRQCSLLVILSPLSALKRGYAILRAQGKVLSSGKNVKVSDKIAIELNDANLDVIVETVNLK